MGMGTMLGVPLCAGKVYKLSGNVSLMLYCGYKYTHPCMINRIWGLKQLWLQMNGHAWFYLQGSVDLFGMGRERKIQNENICLQRDSNPLHASPRKKSQRLRPLGHEGLIVIGGLMSYRILGFKLKKTVTWQTHVKLIMVTCTRIWTESQTQLSFLISM